MQIYQKKSLTNINNFFTTMFRLKQFRKKHELRQSEIGEILGVNQSNISRMENDNVDLTPTQIDRLRKQFDDVDEFIVDDMLFINRGNTMHGEGTQNNGYLISADKELIEIISKQNETIVEQMAQQNRLIEQQSQLTEKIMSLFERFMRDGQ